MRIHLLALLVLVAILMSGCSNETVHRTAEGESSSSDRSEALVIVDDRGRNVTIRSMPQRIVSLTPSGTEILFALGVGERVVGVTKWCDYPAEAKTIPQVGDVNISVEKVVSLEPDLVIAHSTLNESVIRQLEGLGKTVIALNPKSIEEVTQNISLIGRACGRHAEADILNDGIQEVIRGISESNAGTTGLKTLVVIQPNPLWAAGPETFVDEMITVCNAENIAHDARQGFNTFPVERALARDPQVIIVGRESERQFFLKSPVWKDTDAVRSGRIVVINPDLLVRPGPRLSDGLQELAVVLHIRE
jgi:iron complex transport system substrate-binding protein